MPREIPLTQGKAAIVDDADYDWLMQRPWHFAGGYAHHTAPRSAGNRNVAMHRLIMGATPEQEVDHRNGDGLDNRRDNVRVCTRAGNTKNLAKRAGTRSRYKGVSAKRDARHKLWRADIRADRQAYHLGSFASEDEAARAYDQAARRLHGEFARLNFPEEV